MLNDETARAAVLALVEYCDNTGCYYCQFWRGDDDHHDQLCKIGKPRNWEVKNENSNGTGQGPDDDGIMQTGMSETVNDEILPD